MVNFQVSLESKKHKADNLVVCIYIHCQVQRLAYGGQLITVCMKERTREFFMIVDAY